MMEPKDELQKIKQQFYQLEEKFDNLERSRKRVDYIDERYQELFHRITKMYRDLEQHSEMREFFQMQQDRLRQSEQAIFSRLDEEKESLLYKRRQLYQEEDDLAHQKRRMYLNEDAL
ncbi:DUF3958 family protein [Oceanobacillus sp. CFH 90083]|uniref:DUF3958 family protein n=1 Tax=Oceanobacillus sp. CFH 90083 TaxID=2592336 RepID=UPI00128DA109|nr:DUF3958 family protein [Oceanobacillus sp. CFH 90083]